MNNQTLNRTLCGALFTVLVAMVTTISADPTIDPQAPSDLQESTTIDSGNALIPDAHDTGSVDGTGRALSDSHDTRSVDGTGRALSDSHDTRSVDGTGRALNDSHDTRSVDGTGFARSIISTLAAPVSGSTSRDADAANCEESNSATDECTALVDTSDERD